LGDGEVEFLVLSTTPLSFARLRVPLTTGEQDAYNTGYEPFRTEPTRDELCGFGGFTNLFSKKIHAVTPRGFELKIVWFLLAFSIQYL